VLFEVLQLGGAIKKGWLGHWLWAFRELTTAWPDLVRRRRAFQGGRIRRDLDVLRGGPFPYHPAMVSGGIEQLARRLLDAVAALNWRLAGPTG
jgi:hypothetical protein